MDRPMELLRRILPWLCAAVMVLSGAVGRGAVLCVAADGGTRVELADNAGRCLEGVSEHSATDPRECPQFASAHGDCEGCQDVAIASGSARPTSGGAESLLTLPPLVFLAVVPRHDLSVNFLSRIQRPREVRPASLSSDVYALRKTVTLLI